MVKAVEEKHEKVRCCGLYLAGLYGGRAENAHLLARGNGRMAVGALGGEALRGTRMAAQAAVGLCQRGGSLRNGDGDRRGCGSRRERVHLRLVLVRSPAISGKLPERRLPEGEESRPHEVLSHVGQPRRGGVVGQAQFLRSEHRRLGRRRGDGRVQARNAPGDREVLPSAELLHHRRQARVHDLRCAQAGLGTGRNRRGARGHRVVPRGVRALGPAGAAPAVHHVERELHQSLRRGRREDRLGEGVRRRGLRQLLPLSVRAFPEHRPQLRGAAA